MRYYLCRSLIFFYITLVTFSDISCSKFPNLHCYQLNQRLQEAGESFVTSIRILVIAKIFLRDVFLRRWYNNALYVGLKLVSAVSCHMIQKCRGVKKVTKFCLHLQVYILSSLPVPLISSQNFCLIQSRIKCKTDMAATFGDPHKMKKKYLFLVLLLIIQYSEIYKQLY